MTESHNSQIRKAIRVFTLPALTSQGRWRLESLQSRSDHLFFWITRGQGKIRVGASLRGFGPNTVMFIPAGQIHAIIPSQNSQGYVGFLPDSLPVPVPDEPTVIKANSIVNQGQMTGYFEMVSLENNTRQAGSEHVMESYFTLISVWMARRKMRNDWVFANKPTASQTLAHKFLRRLEDNHPMGLSISTFAAVLDVTPTHLSRVCREVFQQPASDMVHDRTILAAKYALADSNRKVSEIAASLGFGSAAYFTRLFRQLNNISPRDFRLQIRAHARKSTMNTAG